MARGFGGETTEQEARGNEGLSSSDIAGGRQDAATSAMASGRDVDIGGGSDGSGGFLSNDYTPDFNRVSQIQDMMQAQKSFNRSRGITDTNPFGNDNIFTKYLGIDPKNIDYTQNISRSNRISIANNQFSKFMNPQNKPGMVGYNPDFPTAEEGQLRAGAQSAGFKTQFGDVMGQARQQSTGEMVARGLAGLFGGLPGFALGQIGTQEYGLPGQPGFDRFDPENPNPSGGILGQFLGGLNPTQAKDALVGAFAPVTPAPTPKQLSSVEQDVPSQQLAGSFYDTLFRDPNISPEAREILKEKDMTIDDLFAPKTSAPVEEKPDIMNMIQSITDTASLGGPSTANQYADLSGLLSQGMAIAGDIVDIPGGYMDTRTGKQYSGSYNPSVSGRTYTGKQRSSGTAPFSGAALRQGIANFLGG